MNAIYATNVSSRQVHNDEEAKSSGPPKSCLSPQIQPKSVGAMKEKKGISPSTQKGFEGKKKHILDKLLK